MATDTYTLYIKMKNESGSEVWRNMAPSVGTGEKRLNFKYDDYETGTEVVEDLTPLTTSFVTVQTETPALDNGQIQYKIVSEHYLNGSNVGSNVLPGTDAWTDTTDEKLVVSVTTGDKDGTARLPHAASALGQASTHFESYTEAVSTYSRYVADLYRIGSNGDNATWTQTHLTGTKDTLVARNS